MVEQDSAHLANVFESFLFGLIFDFFELHVRWKDVFPTPFVDEVPGHTVESVKCHPTQRADLGQNSRFHLVKRVQIHRIVIWLVDPHLLPEVWQCHVPGLLLLSTCLPKKTIL